MAKEVVKLVEQPAKACPDGLAVIHVALFRMGTRSVAEAYRILGYKTHHGTEDVLGNPWPLIEQVTDATWPDLTDAKPRARFSREDWDALWGSDFDVVTDMACPFVEQLIETYPDAKIVVVQREFDSWWRSLKAGILDNLFPWKMKPMIFLIVHVIRSRAPYVMIKILYGLFGARSEAEIEANARRTYDRYYQRIREMVPPERRLEYNMADGWEPLCAFLGKDVPDVPFPRLNDSKARRKRQTSDEMDVVFDSFRKLAPLILAGVVAFVAAFYLQA